MKNVKVNAYQRGLVFKNDAYQRMLTEGSYWFWGNEVVKLYDIKSHQTRQFTGHRAGVNDVEFSPDGKLLARTVVDDFQDRVAKYFFC